MTESKMIEEIVTALGKIVERMNSSENRLRSLEEALTTSLKRLNVLENDLKKISHKGNEKLDGMEAKIETLGLKYVEMAKEAKKIELITSGSAQKQEIEKLRTLIEVLR